MPFTGWQQERGTPKSGYGANAARAHYLRIGGCLYESKNRQSWNNALSGPLANDKSAHAPGPADKNG